MLGSTRSLWSRLNSLYRIVPAHAHPTARTANSTAPWNCTQIPSIQHHGLWQLRDGTQPLRSEATSYYVTLCDINSRSWEGVQDPWEEDMWEYVGKCTKPDGTPESLGRWGQQRHCWSKPRAQVRFAGWEALALTTGPQECETGPARTSPRGDKVVCLRSPQLEQPWPEHLEL